jgi:HD-GYP domain-containing protein (c-di-GMP phosphodiesterase class II)
MFSADESEIQNIIYKHHSYLDGTGYPPSNSNDIPFESQVIAAADLFDHTSNIFRK